ncbi:Ingression protein fic1 [Wickerhamiella sorbophila]|uniref:Ingression protein fic1 n=1 Tax=Wickerhamiella sorbophila TaxID=45607 RepID=A0A2T0FL48_9ASCO|nr:Ingression protein fic1 [Wickerhamiella sorbophila]PRT55716.1 Ingression protein fic1 [Wickerhamiella sorbophila]
MDTNLPEPTEVGTLIVVVMKAKNLHNKRALSKQNPFCSVRVATSAHKTKTIDRGGQCPSWDQEMRFNIFEGSEFECLKLSVFDQNRSTADIVGDAVIPLKPAFEARVRDGYDAWHPIYFNKRYTGEVYLEMTFYSKNRRRSSPSRRSSTASASSLSSIPSPNSSFSSGRRQLPQIPQPQGANVSLTHSRSSSSTRSVSPSRTPRPLPQVPGAPRSSLYKQSFDSVPNLHQFTSSDPEHVSPWGDASLISSASFHQDLHTMMNLSNNSAPCLTQSRKSDVLSPIDQEDISRQINDGFGESMFERIRP